MQEKPTWIQVSITIDGELAEAVAEVFSRTISDGVVLENTDVLDDPESHGQLGNMVKVFGYIPVDSSLESAKTQIEQGLFYLNMISSLPEITYTTVEQLDWSEAWKKNFRPLRVGKQLQILPAWVDERDDEECIAIIIDPGMAFGTGTHPTTTLCLEMIEQIYIGNEYKPEKLIDVGCGSGILSIAGIKLGATYALAVDKDADAIVNAQKNIKINDVVNDIDLHTGSVEEILRGEYAISQASLVVANIIAPILKKLIKTGLTSLVAPDGLLVLSGMLNEQEAEIVQLVEEQGFTITKRVRHDDWRAFAATPSSLV